MNASYEFIKGIPDLPFANNLNHAKPVERERDRSTRARARFRRR